MNDLVIQTHNFEVAKRRLKEFLQNQAEDLEIGSVRTDGGLFGLGNHKVTGDELNSILTSIQKHLVDLNSKNNTNQKEFGEVYNALEALDKDYIQAILISIKATEKTSESIKATIEKTDKIVNDQKKTLTVLKNFKQTLDSYAHLSDIDSIWNDCRELYDDMTTLSNSINKTILATNTSAGEIDRLRAALKTTDEKITYFEQYINHQIESILAFTCELEKIAHLHDIDEMWELLSKANNSYTDICNYLNSIKDTVKKQQCDIETLLTLMDTLSDYEHLQDIDELWNSNEMHSIQLTKLENQSEKTNNFIQDSKKFIDMSIAEAVEKSDTAVQSLSKKIKYAYMLAGGTLGLALIELVIILFR